ncbi:dTDP-4-dehydrorhamnose 3,5-epimerase [Primorskyibacter sedentarius]|uniref:dTDP-4-dehydrorhamnose 3,5-epimerase n=1 Tax=Primorskyibacter sedentarius TaxID=745311 RepID=UPI003EB73B9F
MDIEQTKLEGVLVITPKRFSDARGSFSEVWNRQTMREAGLDFDFVQDNQSISTKVGTIRGLHYQAPPHAQDKLVRAGRGRVLDVVVDVRRGSPGYMKWIGVELSEENGRQLFVPKGFLHGFITREPDSMLLYKTTDVYAPECDGSVHFADPEIGIDWGIDPAAAVVSDKDAKAPTLKEWTSPFEYEG